MSLNPTQDDVEKYHDALRLIVKFQKDKKFLVLYGGFEIIAVTIVKTGKCTTYDFSIAALNGIQTICQIIPEYNFKKHIEKCLSRFEIRWRPSHINVWPKRVSIDKGTNPPEDGVQ